MTIKMIRQSLYNLVKSETYNHVGSIANHNAAMRLSHYSVTLFANTTNPRHRKKDNKLNFHEYTVCNS